MGQTLQALEGYVAVMLQGLALCNSAVTYYNDKTNGCIKSTVLDKLDPFKSGSTMADNYCYAPASGSTGGLNAQVRTCFWVDSRMHRCSWMHRCGNGSG